MNSSKLMVAGALVILLALSLRPAVAGGGGAGCGNGTGGFSKMNAGAGFGNGMAGFSKMGGCSNGNSFNNNFASSGFPNPIAQQAETIARQDRQKQARLARQEKSAQARYASAQQAAAAGNVRLASTLYLRVALTRPQNHYSAAAKEALAGFVDEGRSQLATLEASLASDEPAEVLDKLDQLAEDFEHVPLVSREIVSRRDRLRREYAAAIAARERLNRLAGIAHDAR